MVWLFAYFVLSLQCISVFSQSALVLQVEHEGEITYMEGSMIDTCFCNATSCEMTTASYTTMELTPFVEVNVTVYYGSSCSGDGIVQPFLYPAVANGTSNCASGEVDVVESFTIAPADAYNNMPSAAIDFLYSSTDDCNSGLYKKFTAGALGACGVSFGSICNNENITTAAVSADSMTEIVYTNSDCNTVEAEVTFTYPISCTPVDTDDPYDYNPYETVQTKLFTGYSGNSEGSSNSDDTYAVSKSDYVGLIVTIFIAFAVGIAIGFCVYKHKSGNTATEDLTVRLTGEMQKSGPL